MASYEMQFLIDATTMKIQQLKSRHMAYKVDDSYFNNAAIISLQVKRHCRYAANKSYLLSAVCKSDNVAATEDTHHHAVGTIPY